MSSSDQDGSDHLRPSPLGNRINLAGVILLISVLAGGTVFAFGADMQGGRAEDVAGITLSGPEDDDEGGGGGDDDQTPTGTTRGTGPSATPTGDTPTGTATRQDAFTGNGTR